MFTHVKSLESYLRGAGKLPVNVKCLFEGEEEVGSPSLMSFVAKNKRALAADVAVMSDTQMLAPDRPAISYSERGALGLELEVRGPRHDLHSGNFGGAVLNPLQALTEIIAKLHDSSGHIRIPGFYNRVRQWGEGERVHMGKTGRSDAQILRDATVDRDWGEQDLVFCNAQGKPFQKNNLLERSYYPLLRKAGLPHIRFHDLRHTTATLLLLLGVHPKIVQALLGHSQIVVTLDTYSHVLPPLHEDAMHRLHCVLTAPLFAII